MVGCVERRPSAERRPRYDMGVCIPFFSEVPLKAKLETAIKEKLRNEPHSSMISALSWVSG